MPTIRDGIESRHVCDSVGQPSEATYVLIGLAREPPVVAAPILLFDGVCTLCDGAVQFVMRHDAAERFQFASLQSDAARPFLERAGLGSDYLASLVLVDEHGAIHTGSDAALGVGRRLDAPWRQLATAARIVPRPLREGVYRLIARSRYRVFGKKDECRLPTPAERERFLEYG